MRSEDTPQVTKIDLACFPTMLPATNYRTELINPLAHYIVALGDERPVESDDQSIVGFAGLWMLAGEAHIINIAVHEACQGRGLGELLLLGLSQKAQGLQAIMLTLEVRVSNTVAQKLYVKYGFTERGRRRAYYTDNREDAIIMTLDDPASPAYSTALDVLRRDYEQRWQRNSLLGDD